MKLPKATGVDPQYRFKLIKLANGFSVALNKCKAWEFNKKKTCENAIYDIYLALRN